MSRYSQLLINPFENLSDRAMLWIGFIGYVWASVQVYLFRYVPDGVFQQHLVSEVSWYAGLVNVAINILLPSALLWGMAKALYNKVRWLDVFIVLMLSQVVNYVVGFLLLNPYSRSKSEHIIRAIEAGDMTLETVAPFDLLVIGVTSIIGLILLVYFFYLLVVGMKIAMNSKKRVHAVWIVLVIIIADTLLHLWGPYVK
ncbi:YIP1 family protein [Sphingobacterium sp. lm-10]|uniref:YIP1 family protein n=1 Tax=Sphingobacterium sp. lm-10 TaxID=2944904 RepID=UPI0020202E93|nr:YIP1 family protein [Sphingobacterium sp. lm-10]MCL7988840.1 YIP1 family protein [Sphingobacterium sp. lm-10]